MYSSVIAALIPLVAVAGSTSLLRASGQWVAPVLLVEIVLLVTMAWAGAQQYLRAAKLRTQSKPTR